jgi:hypothetical protein
MAELARYLGAELERAPHPPATRAPSSPRFGGARVRVRGRFSVRVSPAAARG